MEEKILFQKPLKAQKIKQLASKDQSVYLDESMRTVPESNLEKYILKHNEEKLPVVTEIKDNIAIITLNGTNNFNPISQPMMKAICNEMQKADTSPEVKAIIVYGGKGRSFSAGGDFNEVQAFKGGKEVETWIKNVIELYVEGSLKISKPIIGALDEHVIGAGFQLALTFNWRIATPRTKFLMPELKNGVACPVGAVMLRKLVGLLQAEEIVIGCNTIDAMAAKSYRIINDIVPSENLLESAITKAKELGNYPEITFKMTKPFMKLPLIKALENNLEYFINVHQSCFSTGVHLSHVEKILGNKYAGTENNKLSSSKQTTSIPAK